jgi:transposase-like protein
MEKGQIYLGMNYYSLELKHLICKEHIEKGATLSELTRKYELSSHSLIHNWLRKYGYLPSTHRQLNRKRIYIGIENIDQLQQIPSPPSPPNSTENISEIVRLQKELIDAKIQLEGYQRMIEIAENELKIPIRKKSNTK